MTRPKFYVLTWDTYKQKFTPQRGVRAGPYTLFGLRKAVRKLREMGYGCERWDNSVLVCRQDEKPA
jgi:hypothetical protein